jgi:hypothetical protein
VSKAGFKLKQRFNLKEHFKNAFGIMNLEEEPEKVVIRSTKEQAEYLKSSPLHHSQQIQKETEKSVYFTYDLYPTYDFIQEILSYGNQVKVTEPKSLMEKIKETLKQSISQYDDPYQINNSCNPDTNPFSILKIYYICEEWQRKHFLIQSSIGLSCSGWIRSNILSSIL